MSIFKRIVSWLEGLFSLAETEHAPKRSLPPVHFACITSVQKPPKNKDIEEKTFYYVTTSGKPKWALFLCPCGCGDVITLSLQEVHTPSWKLTKAVSGHPTLQPSVWRDKGCLSHFWLKEGRVFWCPDTGTHPDLRRGRVTSV
ncbi:DUF6527 family protein [Hahella sp. KA22]|uniref:DUF6527 family protein n=1 Tax=Hahella sp. KA22 TaxID=1628392 RepID=UPI00351A0562